MLAQIRVFHEQTNGLATKGLGFRRERVQYLNANHRDICKFDSPDDPNYVTLKNAIISATQDISKDGMFVSYHHNGKLLMANRH